MVLEEQGDALAALEWRLPLRRLAWLALALVALGGALLLRLSLRELEAQRMPAGDSDLRGVRAVKIHDEKQ